MICNHCGASLPQGSTFCTNCGARLVPAPTGRKKNKALTVALIAALVIALIAGTIFSVCFLLNAGERKTAALWQEQYDLGNRYLSEGNYEDAVIAFCAAIDIDPKNPDAYLGAAEAYIALGDPEAAEEILQEGIEEVDDTSDLEDMLETLQELLAASDLVANPDKQLIQVLHYTTEGEYACNFSYNQAGQLTSIHFIRSFPGGITEDSYEFTYDEDGRILTSLYGTPDDFGYAYIEYFYDGNRLSYAIEQRTEETVTIDYMYDEKDQLLQVTSRSDVDSEIIEHTEYLYNEFGQVVQEIYTRRDTTFYYDYTAYPWLDVLSSDSGSVWISFQEPLGVELWTLSAGGTDAFVVDPDGYLQECFNPTDGSHTVFVYGDAMETLPQEPLPEESQAPTLPQEDFDWKAAMHDFIVADAAEYSEYGLETNTYYLFYLNDDDIPELWIDSSINASGCKLVYASGNTFVSEFFARSYASYIERENLLHVGSGAMGVYGNSIYAIENGKLMHLCGGYYEALTDPDGYFDLEHFDYYWEGQSVTEEEYDQHLDSAFNPNKALFLDAMSSPSYTYQEILAYLAS